VEKDELELLKALRKNLSASVYGEVLRKVIEEIEPKPTEYKHCDRCGAMIPFNYVTASLTAFKEPRSHTLLLNGKLSGKMRREIYYGESTWEFKCAECIKI
jgi:hypothetical protein